jgi:hypothetical protein
MCSKVSGVKKKTQHFVMCTSLVSQGFGQRIEKLAYFCCTMSENHILELGDIFTLLPGTHTSKDLDHTVLLTKAHRCGFSFWLQPSVALEADF